MAISVLFIAASIASTNLLGNSAHVQDASQYWLKGDSLREEDAACGWPASPTTCSVNPRAVTLLPGSVAVVDDFLNDSEYQLLHDIVEEGIVGGDPQYGASEEEEILNVSFSAVMRLPDERKETSMLALLRRIHGNAIRTIRSASEFKSGPWAYKGAYFPDFWVIRRYHQKGQQGAKRLGVHTDTGSHARCLSAVLFLGDKLNEHSTLQGGTFRTHRCRKGHCTAYGWQYDDDFQPIDESLLRDSNLVTLVEVPYKPGRLLFFLSETLHDVTEVVEGHRDVLFMWFGCEPSLLNSISENGHLALVEFLVTQKADVTLVNPNSKEGPIHHAVEAGHTDITQFLLARDPEAVHKPRVINNNWLLPLHEAAAVGHMDVVKLLVHYKAEVGAKDSAGWNATNFAWQYAPKGADAAIAKLLQDVATPSAEL